MNDQSKLVYELVLSAANYFKCDQIFFMGLSKSTEWDGTHVQDARFFFQNKDSLATRKLSFMLPQEVELKHIYRAMFELKDYGMYINLTEEDVIKLLKRKSVMEELKEQT